MKSLSKKAIVVSIITLVTVPSVAFAGWNYTHQNKKSPEAVASTSINPIIYPEKKAEPTPEIVTTPVVEVPTAPVVVPVILSSDEYAAKYLDLSTTFLQECWTTLKQMYPERFTEQVREKSIKRITPAYGNICGQRKLLYTSSDGSTRLYNYILGVNGEYFDR